MRKVKARLPDRKVDDATHHGNARYVLRTTENDIKAQRLVIELRKKQAAEKARQQKEKDGAKNGDAEQQNGKANDKQANGASNSDSSSEDDAKSSEDSESDDQTSSDGEVRICSCTFFSLLTPGHRIVS